MITGVTIRIKKQAISGTNPFTIHGLLTVDMKTGFFHDNPALEKLDFQAIGSRGNVGRFIKTPAEGWYRAPLRAPSYLLVNLTGHTQFRLRFVTDDNDDLGADYLSFYTGNAADGHRPARTDHHLLRAVGGSGPSRPPLDPLPRGSASPPQGELAESARFGGVLAQERTRPGCVKDPIRRLEDSPPPSPEGKEQNAPPPSPSGKGRTPLVPTEGEAGLSVLFALRRPHSRTGQGAASRMSWASLPRKYLPDLVRCR